jgi:hypothetical protein
MADSTLHVQSCHTGLPEIHVIEDIVIVIGGYACGVGVKVYGREGAFFHQGVKDTVVQNYLIRTRYEIAD